MKCCPSPPFAFTSSHLNPFRHNRSTPAECFTLSRSQLLTTRVTVPLASLSHQNDHIRDEGFSLQRVQPRALDQVKLFQSSRSLQQPQRAPVWISYRAIKDFHPRCVCNWWLSRLEKDEGPPNEILLIVKLSTYRTTTVQDKSNNDASLQHGARSIRQLKENVWVPLHVGHASAPFGY